MKLTRRLAAALALFVTTACTPPTTPSTTPTPTAAGALLSVTASPTGAVLSGSSLTIAARVRTDRGDSAVGELVQFTTSAGTLSAASAVTDRDGVATVTLDTSVASYVTAATASAAGALTIAARAPYSVAVATSGPLVVQIPALLLVTVTPGVGMGSPPAPTSITVSCAEGPDVAVTNGAAPCTFTQAGPSIVRVRASSANGWSATGTTAIVVEAAYVPPVPPPPPPPIPPVLFPPVPPLPPPPPPPAPQLSATVSCSATHADRLRVACNVHSLSYGGQPVPAAEVTSAKWDLGNGQDITTTRPVHEYVYSQPGTYSVHVTVTADTPDGSASAVATTSITVPRP